METLGGRIRRLREAAGLTLQQIGDHFRPPISRGAVAQWERDETRPDQDKLVELAEKLRVTVDELLGGDTTAVRETPAPYVDGQAYLVPVLEFGGSMGRGAILHDHNPIIETARINITELRRQCTFTSPQNLRILPGYGDSMEPTFADGDPLLVDTGVSDIKIDAIYVLERDDDLYIKRLQRRPDGAFLMISDNKKYEPYVIQNGEREKFAVRGRVLMAWNGKRL